jgi:hypothetical protein
MTHGLEGEFHEGLVVNGGNLFLRPIVPGSLRSYGIAQDLTRLSLPLCVHMFVASGSVWGRGWPRRRAL